MSSFLFDITSQIGDLQAAYLTGDFAIGKDSKIIDLALVGDKLNRPFIDTLVEKTESFISPQNQIHYTEQRRNDSVLHQQPVLLI